MLAALGVLGFVAAGCGDVADEMPKVSGEVGQPPEITLPSASPRGFSVTVLKAGDGELVRPGDVANVNYSAVTWPGDQHLGDTYSQGGAVPLNTIPSSTPGLNEALAGKRVGSRLLLVLPQPEPDPAEMQFAPQDVEGIAYPAVSGAQAPVAAGLPQVTGAPGQRPEITVPRTPAPSELVVQPLITGSGPKIKAGDTLIAQYEGVVWPGGREFDSSWGRGSPASFPIGVGQVIPGWDKGLVGQPIGSRVLLVIPPAEGYGTDGNPQAGISGTDTLVFVVDILGVDQSQPQPAPQPQPETEAAPEPDATPEPAPQP